MAERKVLVKYIHPDFDPSKLIRTKKPKNNQQQVRLMLPMSVLCDQCGEYVHKGKKFNGRKEEVVGETYLGIKIYRLYFRCTTCLHEITFKTDPEHSDYTVERGATRNFEPWKQAAREEILETKKREREEVGDAMKALENRTQESKNAMEVQDAIDEVRERNARAQGLSTDDLLGIHVHAKENLEEEQIEETARRAFEAKRLQQVVGRRLEDPMDLDATTASTTGTSLPVLKRLPDPTDFTRDDDHRRVDLLSSIVVSDSEDEGEDQKTGGAHAAAAAATSVPSVAAASVPSVPLLPSGLVMLPKKRKNVDATDGGADDAERKEKRKKEKKAKKENNKQAETPAVAAAVPPSEEGQASGGLGGLLGGYDSD